MAARGAGPWLSLIVCLAGCTRSGYVGHADLGSPRDASRDRSATDPRRERGPDLPAARWEGPPRDVAPLRDGPKRDHALWKDAALKDVPKKDLPLVKTEKGLLDASGAYAISPTISYSCAFGVVSFNITTMTFADDGKKLTITTAPTGPKGGCSVLVGDTATDGAFTATCTYPGACAETYTLSGALVGTTGGWTSWSGTYTAAYAGGCLNCATQSWAVTGTRK